MSETTIRLGPTGEEFSLQIVRGYNTSGDDYVTNAVEYRCFGVESIDIDDPYNIGGGQESVFHLTFTNGKTARVEGVITELVL